MCVQNECQPSQSCMAKAKKTSHLGFGVPVTLLTGTAQSIPRPHLSFDRQADPRPCLSVCRLPRPLYAGCPPPSMSVKALRCTSTSSPAYFPFSFQHGLLGLIYWVPHRERQPLAHLPCVLRVDGGPFTVGLLTCPWVRAGHSEINRPAG